MTNRAGERRFCPCGTRLARDNRGKLCTGCRKVVSGHIVQRPLVPRSFWQSTELREALDAWHIGQAIRAYRLHEFHPEPIAQATVANWFGVTQAQLSRIENGSPVTDLARLIPWALALGIPEELLWFKLPKERAGLPVGSAVTATTSVCTQHDATEGGPDKNPTLPPISANCDSDSEERDMRRRALLQGILAGTGTVLSAAALGNLAQIEQVRRELDTLFDGSGVGETTIERWETAANEHSLRWLEMAPGQRLNNVAGDFVELRHLLGRPQTTKHRATLTRVSSELAVLAGFCLHDMGDHRSAQAWFHTAGLAAKEAQDRQLSGLALVSSAVDGLYHDPPERTLTRIAKARAFLGRQATPWRVKALVVEARALAMLNRGQEAQHCIVEAESAFQAMPASALADSAFGYPERLFCFTVGNAYTCLGMAREADAMQCQALSLYPATEYQDVAMTQLDQAQCMVKQGDVASACEYALHTITAVPGAHRGLVVHYGRGFLAQLPDAGGKLPPARELRELLATAN